MPADDPVARLAEQSPAYSGRGSGDVDRLRGTLLAGFEASGLPPGALPFVLEELETGRSPYAVAAAAKGLRGAKPIPQAALPLLMQAIERFRSSDDRVGFDGPAGADGRSTTVLVELIRSVAALGSDARPALGALREMLDGGPDEVSAAVRAELRKAIGAASRSTAPERTEGDACCAAEAWAAASPCCGGAGPALPGVSAIGDVAVQDQDGAVLTLAEALLGHPSVLTFFYTRCMNPDKCSRTVAKLARLQRRLADHAMKEGVNIVAMTYDPAFDQPARLRAYGADRGLRFGPRSRLLRTTGPFDAVRSHFDLGVGFGPVTVNRHRLDLFVLDSAGEVAGCFERMLWSEDAVLNALDPLIAASATRPGS